MSINLITAISNFHIEDTVIESLTQREFTLHFRALIFSDLEGILKSCQEDQRYLLVIDQEFAQNFGEIKKYLSENISYLILNGDNAPHSDLLLEMAYESLRRVESVSNLKITRSLENAIGVTGSWASPGVTSVALNLAAEISLSRKISLNDVNPHRRDVMHLLGLKRDQYQVKLTDNLSVVDLGLEELENLPQFPTDELSILDLGSAPDLQVSLSDRRAPGRKFAELLQSCKELVFVTSPESHGLQHMVSFSSQLQVLIPNMRVTYVLNKLGSSSRHQGLKRSFQKKIGEFDSEGRSFLIPADYALIDRAQGRFASIMEISPRSALRRAFQDISVHLNK